jgi:hypothetical protein
MSDLASLVGNLLTNPPRPPDKNNGAALMRRRGEDNRQAVLQALRTAGLPLGVVAIAGRTSLTRACVLGHLEALEVRGQVERTAKSPRAPWAIVCKKNG